MSRDPEHDEPSSTESTSGQATADSAPAAATADFEPTDLASLPDFYHPTVSPDGERVAVYHDRTGRNELYILNVATGELEQFSDGEVPRNARWPIAWDGTGDRVFFHLDEGGDEQNDLHAFDLESRAVESVVSVDGQAIFQDVTDDGRYVLYASDESAQMNLYRYDTETDETRQLTAFEQPARGGSFSPDGDRVAFVSNESDDLANRDTYIVDADGGDPTRIDVPETTDGASTTLAEWGPDGDRLLLSDDSADTSRIGVYDLTTETVTWLGDGTHEERAAGFSPDGSLALGVRVREAGVVPIRYDLTGVDAATGEESSTTATEFDVDDGVAVVGGADSFTGETTLTLVNTASAERKTLFEYDLADDTTRTLIAPDYGEIDPDAFVPAEYVTYHSDDWQEIGALLYDARRRPSADPDATDQPVVVMVHGGPHGQSTKSFNLYAQFLVSKGFSVLQPNYRGSTGRGREFRQAVHDDWGGMEQADVAAGGRYMAAREWVDEDRVAVFGGSYGGYSAFMQLVKYPTLWATGVAWMGITDLHALYEESMPHYRTMLEQQLGEPETNTDLWTQRSPVTHVGNLRRPVFIVHGVNDPRCPISQARIFRDALLDRGLTAGPEGDFEYEELDEEGHGSTDQAQKLRAFELVGDYLDRRL